MASSSRPRPAEPGQAASLLAGREEQRFFDELFAVVAQFERAVLVDLEGKIIEGMFTGEYVVVQQDTAPNVNTQARTRMV